MTQPRIDGGSNAHPISVARPLLPPAASLLPYLERIDASRVYANQGPLVRLLQDRLAAHFRLPAGTIATTSNATVGLSLALSALGVQPGTLCLMPAWTFAASAHAAVAAGLKPYFLDVDPKTWALAPAAALAAIDRLGTHRIGAVMPVAPFGSPIDTRGWDVFHEQTRIPVVIDAAAGFDTAAPTLVPTVVSLHATKVLGAGEGGFIVSRDASLIVEIHRRANFGFWGAREARVPATNGKMSEYAAAVALAGLDFWPETRGRWLGIAQTYRKALGACGGVTLMPNLGDYATSTCVVQLDSSFGDVAAVAMDLASMGVATRNWWGRGLQVETAFLDCPRESLPITERLGARTIGLPCFVDLSRRDLARVCTALSRVAQPAGQTIPAEALAGKASMSIGAHVGAGIGVA